MKRCKTKLLTWLLVLYSLLLGVCLFACGQTQGDTNGRVCCAKVVVEVTAAEDGDTLKDVMDKLQAEGKLSFVDQGGMITEINGHAVTGNEFWALYTSLEDYANTDWGTTSYKGITYASAMLGYASLPAEVGAVYVWEISVW